MHYNSSDRLLNRTVRYMAVCEVQFPNSPNWDSKSTIIDYRARSQTSDVSPNIAGTSFALFNREEMKALIDTAHSLGVKVAVHANTADVIAKVLDLGADTVEHGGDLLDPNRGGGGTDVIEKWAEPGKNTVWVPTLAVFYSIAQLGLPGAAENWERAKRTFQAVLKIGDAQDAVTDGKGVKIVCGGDTGAFPHGENALEMVMMRRLGASWDTVLRWATLAGWECVRGMEWEGERGQEKLKGIEGARAGSGEGKSALERNVPFGAIRTGWAADLVGIEGAVDGDAAAFEKAVMSGVRFVVKGGSIYKRDGKEVL
jgi:imidazolonepropionase-like amidohydrolase